MYGRYPGGMPPKKRKPQVTQAKRAIGYVRLSNEDDDSTSPERQRQEIQRWCEIQGATLVDIEQDIGISGWSGAERPGFNRALARIESGEANYLVAFKLDRIARRVKAFHDSLETIEDAGGTLVLIHDQVDFSTPMGNVLATMLAAFAQFESDTTSQRTSHALQHLKAQGKFQGGVRPYGWIPAPAPDGQGQVLKLHDVESPLLSEAIERALGGASPGEIAKDFNARGILNSRGKPWTRQAMKNTLVRPGLYGADGEEPIIDQPTWARLQHALHERQPFAPIGEYEADPPLFARGKLVCGNCGGLMSPNYNSRQKWRYMCRNQDVPGQANCSRSINAAMCDDHVVNEMLALFGTAEIHGRSQDGIDEYTQAQLDHIDQRLEDLEQARYIRGEFAGREDTYNELHATLVEQRQELATSIPPTVEFEPTGRTLNEDWEAAERLERVDIANDLVKRIDIAPGTSRRFQPERITVHFGDVEAADDAQFR